MQYSKVDDTRGTTSGSNQHQYSAQQQSDDDWKMGKSTTATKGLLGKRCFLFGARRRQQQRGILSLLPVINSLLSLLMIISVLLLVYAPIQQMMADTVIIDSGSDGGTFEYEKWIVSDIRHIIDIAWTPDGRVLIARKEGEIYIFDDGDLEESNNSRQLIYNVNPCIEQERALFSIAVHPKFGTGSDGQYDYFYAYWVHRGKNGNCNIPDFDNIYEDGPYCQLSRFKLTNSNKLQDEEVLLKTGNAGKKYNHQQRGTRLDSTRSSQEIKFLLLTISSMYYTPR